MGAGASVNARKPTIGQEITAATILLRKASDLPQVLIQRIIRIVLDANITLGLRRPLRLQSVRYNLDDLIDSDIRDLQRGSYGVIDTGTHTLGIPDLRNEWGYLQ